MAESILRYERATVEFCNGLKVDGYRMPDGSYRVGITTASLAAGYAENYLRRALDGTRFKALQGMGFEGKIENLVRVTETGEREERTISTKDFLRFLRYADRQGKERAGKILEAFEELSLNDFFRDAFGDRLLSIEEKRAYFESVMVAERLINHADAVVRHLAHFVIEHPDYEVVGYEIP